MIKYTYDTKHKLNTSNSEQVCLQLLLESFLRVFPDGSKLWKRQTSKPQSSLVFSLERQVTDQRRSDLNNCWWPLHVDQCWQPAHVKLKVIRRAS